jgi:hypothetical protein
MDGSSLHRMSLSLGLSGHPSELNLSAFGGKADINDRQSNVRF